MPVTPLERLANNDALIRLASCHGGRRMSAWPAFLKRGVGSLLKERINAGPYGGTPPRYRGKLAALNIFGQHRVRRMASLLPDLERPDARLRGAGGEAGPEAAGRRSRFDRRPLPRVKPLSSSISPNARISSLSSGSATCSAAVTQGNHCVTRWCISSQFLRWRVTRIGKTSTLHKSAAPFLRRFR